MSVVLLVRLKITDLTAWTALHTGRRLLPGGLELTRVAREDLYLFEPEPGTGTEAFEEDLLRAVAGSNFFVNPNKEAYRYLRPRDRGERLVPPPGAWGILTRTRGDSADAGLRARLLREHPLTGLRAIRRGRLWWLWTRDPGGAPAAKACYEALGPVKGTGAGLLVNPHAEWDRLIDSGGIPWRELEQHLVPTPRQAEESAPAAGRGTT